MQVAVALILTVAEISSQNYSRVLRVCLVMCLPADCVASEIDVCVLCVLLL